MQPASQPSVPFTSLHGEQGTRPCHVSSPHPPCLRPPAAGIIPPSLPSALPPARACMPGKAPSRTNHFTMENDSSPTVYAIDGCSCRTSSYAGSGGTKTSLQKAGVRVDDLRLWYKWQKCTPFEKTLHGMSPFLRIVFSLNPKYMTTTTKPLYFLVYITIFLERLLNRCQIGLACILPRLMVHGSIVQLVW